MNSAYDNYKGCRNDQFNMDSFLIDTSKFCHKVITEKIEKYSTSKIMDAFVL